MTTGFATALGNKGSKAFSVEIPEKHCGLMVELFLWFWKFLCAIMELLFDILHILPQMVDQYVLWSVGILSLGEKPVDFRKVLPTSL